MSGSMYDLSVTTYSPEGKIFQIQYAQKAVETAETTVGIRCKDGVLLGADKLVFSKLLVPGTNRRIFNIQTSIGMAISGKIPDGRHLVNEARKEAAKYLDSFDVPITGRITSERLAMYVNTYTLYGSVRPFGASEIIAGYNSVDGYSLHMIEPSGSFYGYFACTAGKGRQIVKAQLQKRDFKELTCKQALMPLIKMLILSHQQTKQKKHQIEVSWICNQSGNRHSMVPKDLVERAERQAEQSIQRDQMGE